MLISPEVAARSVYPWTMFLIGNIIWIVDATYHKQYPWVWSCVIFATYDMLLIHSRITGTDSLVAVRSFVEHLNQYLL
jgi:hypothetical protein